MSTEPMQILDEVIGAMNEIHLHNSSDTDNDIIKWLTEQIKNLLSEVEAIKTDMESGLSLTNLNFSSMEEFIELMEDYKSQIERLKGMLKTFKNIGSLR